VYTTVSFRRHTYIHRCIQVIYIHLYQQYLCFKNVFILYTYESGRPFVMATAWAKDKRQAGEAFRWPVDKYGLALDSIGVTSMGHLIRVEQHTNNRAPNKRCFFDGCASVLIFCFALFSRHFCLHAATPLGLLGSRRPCLPIYSSATTSL
jgi:hypothetical protein